MTIFLLTYLLSALIVLVTGIVTVKLLGLKSNCPMSRIFLSFTFGLVVLPTLVAVFDTGGKTILSFNIILLGLLGWHGRQKKIEESETPPAYSMLYIVGAVFLLAFAYTYIGAGGAQLRRLQHQDYYFYAEVSRFIATTGTEAVLSDGGFFLSDLPGCRPYHFGDLWLFAVLKTINPAKSYMQLQVLVAFPLLFSVIALGAMALSRKLVPGSQIRQFLAAGFLFIGGFFLPDFLNPAPQTVWLWFLTKPVCSMSQPKIAFYILFLTATALRFLAKDRVRGLLILLFCVPFSVTAIPCVLAAGFLYSVIFLKDSFDRKIVASTYLVVFFAYCAFYLTFYGPRTAGIYSIGSQMPTAIGLTKATLRGVLFFLVPNFMVVAYPLLRESDSQLRELLKLYAFMLSIGVVVWGVLYATKDSHQFFWNLAFPIVTLTIGLGVLVLSRRSAIKALLLWAMFFFMGAVSTQWKGMVYFGAPTNVSPEFVEQVTAILNENRTIVRAGFFLAFAEDAGIHNGSHVTHTHTVAREVRALNDNLRMVSLSDLDFPLKDDGSEFTTHKKRYLAATPLGKFASAHPMVASDKMMENFIIHWKIQYAFAENTSLVPTKLEPFIRRKIVDTSSGQTFIEIDLDLLTESQ
jgi:hypothetical protein